MRARLQRNRVIRCRLGHQAAAKPVIHSRGGQALLCHLRSHATAQRQTPKQLPIPPELALGRDSDVAIEPSHQELADLTRTPMRLLGLQPWRHLPHPVGVSTGTHDRSHNRSERQRRAHQKPTAQL